MHESMSIKRGKECVEFYLPFRFCYRFWLKGRILTVILGLKAERTDDNKFGFHENDRLQFHNYKIQYFFIDNAHLMYNAHPKRFRHSF
jgi:hypothetical protein